MSDKPNNADELSSCSSLVTQHSSLPSRHSSLVTCHCSLVTHSPQETVNFGRDLAKELQPPCLVLLEGELGSGKTTLVKGLLAGLAFIPEDEVTSPSFTLVHEYGHEGKLYHVDLYRIEGARDLATLGLDDLLGQDATILIEWGEKLGDSVPRPCVRIRLEHLGGDERRITVERLT